MRALAERLTQRAGVSLEQHFEVNDTATALDLVDAGLGVALIPGALATRRRGVRVVPLSGRAVEWRISAVIVDPEPGNPAARELRRLITRSEAGNAPRSQSRR